MQQDTLNGFITGNTHPNEFLNLGSTQQRVVLADIMRGIYGAPTGTELRKLKTKQREIVYTTVYYQSQSEAADKAAELLKSNSDKEQASGYREEQQEQEDNDREQDGIPVPVPVPVPPVKADSDSSDKSELERIKELLGVNDQKEAKLDTEAVKALIAAALSDHLKPNIVIVKHEESGESKDMGLQHKQFSDLLVSVSTRLFDGSRLNIWLNGAAGTGKTTAAKKVAEALGLDYYLTGAIDNEYKLAGFIDAQGRIVSTEFRKAWELGGIFLFDEVDASSPNAVLSFNGALANGVCPFPDKNIQRHKDCVIIAAGNSATGATAAFNGRYKPDQAFFDRFGFIEWELDEGLETATASNADWCQYVQKVRAAVKDKKYRDFDVTPRATYMGQALLQSGMPWDKVAEMVIKKTLTAAQWKEVK